MAVAWKEGSLVGNHVLHNNHTLNKGVSMIRNIHIVGPSLYAGILCAALQLKLEQLRAEKEFEKPLIRISDREPEAGSINESDLVVLVLRPEEAINTKINRFTCATEKTPPGIGLWRAAILIPPARWKAGENQQGQFDDKRFREHAQQFASNLLADYFKNNRRGASVSRVDMECLQNLSAKYRGMGLSYNNKGTRLSHIAMEVPSEVGRFVGHFLGVVALAAREFGLLDWRGFDFLPESQRRWDRAHPWTVPPWCRVDLVVCDSGVQILEFDNNVGGWGFMTALQQASGSLWTIADKYRELVTAKPTFILQPARKGYELETRFFAKAVGNEAGRVVFLDEVSGNNGKVLIDGEATQVVHRRFDFHLAAGDPSATLILKAWLEGRLKINPPPISICSKLILAAVWDKSLESMWRKAGLDLDWTHSLIPQTCLLDARAFFGRASSVFKSLVPEKDWGARGVFIGPSEGEAQWKGIIGQALSQREPAVVQSFCPHPEQRLLHVGEDGKPQESSLRMVHRPFYICSEDIGAKFVFAGGIYTASDKSKVHGGENSVFGLLKESE